MSALVSVLMSVHNEPLSYIDTAVESICNQTYPNIEFIIIDDASDSEVYSHLKRLQSKHTIIRLFQNYSNIGLTASLNKGLRLCNGEFIARMDADDYSLPKRIEKEVDFLHQHPEIDILGCGVVSFGNEIKFMSPMSGYTNAQAQTQLFFTSTLCHPSVMIRKSFLNRTGIMYDEKFKKAQDFDLWERASVLGQMRVLPDVLVYYRLHSRQITSTHKSEQQLNTETVINRRLNRLNLLPQYNESLCHYALQGKDNDATIKDIEDWINKLITASSGRPYIDLKVMIELLRERLVIIKLKRRLPLSFTELPSLIRLIRTRTIMKLKIFIHKHHLKHLSL